MCVKINNLIYHTRLKKIIYLCLSVHQNFCTFFRQKYDYYFIIIKNQIQKETNFQPKFLTLQLSKTNSMFVFFFQKDFILKSILVGFSSQSAFLFTFSVSSIFYFKMFFLIFWVMRSQKQFYSNCINFIKFLHISLPY